MVAQKQNLRTIKASGSDARAWSGRQYPDGSFSIGAVPPEKKRKAEKEYDQDWRSTHEIVEWSEKDASEYQAYSDKVAYRTKDDKVDRYLSGLDRCSKLSQPKKRYGLKGITAQGKRKVRSGSALLERYYGKERLGFFTATLPSEKHGVDDVDLLYLAKHWNLVTKRFFEEVVRELKRQSAPTEIIAVTEIQEKRWSKYQQVAPHLHWVMVAKRDTKYKSWYLSTEWLSQLWNRIIANTLGREAGSLGSAGSVDGKRIRKSATRYISKYISKGGKLLREIKEKSSPETLPSQWWTAFGGLRVLIKRNVVNLTQDIIKKYQEAEKVGESWLLWSRWIEVEIDEGVSQVFGLAGGISREAYEFFTGIPWHEPLWE